MKWKISLALVGVGALVALIAGFGYESIPGVVVGIVIAIIGLLFKP